jgi:hypothetical protein
MGDKLKLVARRLHEGGLFDVDGTLPGLAAHRDMVDLPTGLIDALAGAERRPYGPPALFGARPIGDFDRLSPERSSCSPCPGAVRALLTRFGG